MIAARTTYDAPHLGGAEDPQAAREKGGAAAASGAGSGGRVAPGASRSTGRRSVRGARPPGRRRRHTDDARRPGGARGALGRYGEELAARRLTETGLTVLERNWRGGRTGEIDIVAREGDALVVVEVKTRRARTFEHPMAAVTPAKAQRLRALAERWLREHGGAPPGGVRIDLVGVVVPERGAPVVEHARGVA